MKNIYRVGILSLLLLSLTGFTASAQIVNLLYGFSLDATQGKGKVSGLIADQQGAFYGTTYEGGANGYGTIFKLTPPATNGAPWTQTVLHSFCSQPGCFDGSYPKGGLMLGANGALYGTTEYGGDACGQSGCGTVFQLSPPKTGSAGWTYGVVHYFTPAGSGVVDGTNPAAGLIADQQGVLYGTTSGGGLYGKGTVFKLLPDTGDGWKESVINVFGGREIGDGADPTAGLIFGAQGALYGTTYEGGANGYGAIFKMTPPGKDDILWPESVLYSFTGGNDGAYPAAGLVVNDPSAGGLYGTRPMGGPTVTLAKAAARFSLCRRPHQTEPLGHCQRSIVSATTLPTANTP